MRFILIPSLARYFLVMANETKYEYLYTNGRIRILSNYSPINETNIVQALTEANALFLTNLAEIEYLYNYYKGIQPILAREKVYHQEINNKVVENHAREIVAFKVGYLLWKPIEYVARKDKSKLNGLNTLNDYLILEDKVGQDKAIAKWQSICGTAYRLSVQNDNYDLDPNNEAPFKSYAIDPRNAFVVYSADYKKEPVLGVIVDRVFNEKGELKLRFQAYTHDMFYEVVDGKIISSRPHTYGSIPLVEYPLNEERIGDFEQVIKLLDCINQVASNRLDAVDEFVQALMVFENVDIKDEDVRKLKELGAIKIKDASKELKANVRYLTQELNQTQIQTLVNYMYSIVLKIVGMPSQSDGNTNDSSNNGAVILKNGWQGADARASETEVMFKTSERQFLKNILNICKVMTKGSVELSTTDIEIKFTRRNYENLWQKAQVLDLLLKNNKVAPKLAFQVCGLFTDSEEAYQMSESYYEQAKKEAEDLLKQAQTNENE